MVPLILEWWWWYLYTLHDNSIMRRFSTSSSITWPVIRLVTLINFTWVFTLGEFIILSVMAWLVSMVIASHNYFPGSSCVPRQCFTALTSFNHSSLSILIVVAVPLNSASPCIPLETIILSTLLHYSPMNLCMVRWVSLVIMWTY